MRTICQDRFNLELVPLPELYDGASCEGGQHDGDVPALTEVPKLEKGIIEVLLPPRHTILGDLGVVWLSAHVEVLVLVVIELRSAFGVPRHDDGLGAWIASFNLTRIKGWLMRSL